MTGPTKQAGGKRDFSPSSTGLSRSGSGSVNDQPAKKVQLQDNTAKYTSKVDPVPQGDMCNHCGRMHTGLCPFLAYHPDVNKDAHVTFVDSAKGKEYFKSLGYTFLHPTKQADKGLARLPPSFVRPPVPTFPISAGSKGASRDNASGGKSYKGAAPPVVTMTTANILTYLNALISMNNNSDLLLCFVHQVAARIGSARVNSEDNVQGVHTVSVYALLDQGSLAGDFISQQALDSLDIQLQTSRMSGNKPNFNFIFIDGPMPICSGLNGECLNTSSRSLVLNVCFCKESNTNVVEHVSFEVTFRVKHHSLWPPTLLL